MNYENTHFTPLNYTTFTLILLKYEIQAYITKLLPIEWGAKCYTVKNLGPKWILS